jgi:hypothetical protein
MDMETRALTHFIFTSIAAGAGIFLLSTIIDRYVDDARKRSQPQSPQFDPVEEASLESFPASDAPAW